MDIHLSALHGLTRDRTPSHWANIQNNLGNALLRLGKRERGMERLKQAATAYWEAPTERPRERVPLLWAATQKNLCAALGELGTRDSDAERLKEAIRVVARMVYFVSPPLTCPTPEVHSTGHPETLPHLLPHPNYRVPNIPNPLVKLVLQRGLEPPTC